MVTAGFSVLTQGTGSAGEILSYDAEEPPYEIEESDGTAEATEFEPEDPDSIIEDTESEPLDEDLTSTTYESSDTSGALSYTIYEEVTVDSSYFTWDVDIPSTRSQAGNRRSPVVEGFAVVPEEYGYEEWGLNSGEFFYVGSESVYLEEDGYDLDDVYIYDNMFFDLENAEQLSAERTPDEIVIKFRNADEMPGFEGQIQKEIDKVQKLGFVEEIGLYVVKVEDLKNDPSAVLNRFKNNRFVEYVEPNYTLGFSLDPNDPHYKTLKNVLSAINAQNGWDIMLEHENQRGIMEQADRGAAKYWGGTIAIIDSGMIANHADLPVLLDGYSAVASLAYGNDKVGHGTSVAGVVGAATNNIGTVGINLKAKIMPVKVDTSLGTMTVANVAKGIIWATDNGAKVINLSLGSATDNATTKSAIDYAYGKGVAIFAATGNASRNGVDYPARYDNVIGVGATTDGVTKVDFSNYGTGVDVVAIGNYHTTTATGDYAIKSGTSFATPQVAGLASLIYAVNPNATNEEVYALIKQAAKPLGGGFNAQTGYGLIDIGRTLALANAGNVDQKPTYTPPSLKLNGFAEVTLFVGDPYIETGYAAIDCFGNDITASVEITGFVNINKDGLYTLNYTVTDDGGNTVKTNRTVIVVAKPVEPKVIDPPTMTILGADPIILHVNSSTPYFEQGVLAVDGDGEDLSGNVEIYNELVRNQAGLHYVNYRVVGKSGSDATAQREVWVIRPALEKVVRTPYGLSGQGKQGMKVTHTGIVANNAGWIDLKLSNIDRNMVISAQLVNSATRDVVVEDLFSAAGTKQYKVNAGRYDLAVTIGKAVGNSKYTINMLMPEIVEYQYTDREVY